MHYILIEFEFLQSVTIRFVNSKKRVNALTQNIYLSCVSDSKIIELLLQFSAQLQLKFALTYKA